MKKIPIARPGYPYLLAGVAGTIFFYVAIPLLFPVSLLLTIFIIYFFRDPARKVPPGNNLVLAPADGKILRVERAFEPEFIKGEAYKISIFLSLFDVHVNRSPFKGVVSFSRYVPGRFLPAYREEATRINERNLIGIQTERGKMLVVQVAGLIARRIVCWAGPGDAVEPGQQIGIIKFGSCTELYLPLETRLKIKEGDKVRGGETVVGEL